MTRFTSLQSPNFVATALTLLPVACGGGGGNSNPNIDIVGP
ncbi:MAG: hypothetical protein OXC62_07530 [Aestuariivita sp.]|nr:hypothetical protein [Aestuariivita sp.]